MSASSRLRTSLLISACVGFSATAALAQDVQYRSVTKIDMGMGLNFAMKLAGASENAQTTYIKGNRMRQESDKSTATIFDMDHSRFIIINNGNKTYMSVPIAQMTAAFSEMSSNVNARSNGLLTGTGRDSAGDKFDYTVNISMEPTNDHDNVNGQDARRTFATVKTDLKVTPQGDTQATDAGTLVILIDTWNANGGPAYTAVHNFQQAMSKEVREQAFSNMKGTNAAFAANPQMGDAMKKAAAEQAKEDGIAMRSVSYLVIVPASLTFDRDAVIKPAEDNGGTGGAVKRGLGGMLSGALRGKTGSSDNNSSTPSQPKQVTMMKITTDVRDVQTTSLPESLFEAPAGYREVPFTPPTMPVKK